MSDSWEPMDCNRPDFSVQGIFQAKILEWVAISLFRGSSQCRDWTQVSYIDGGFFFFLIYFNWRLITLQYCIGFAIHWHNPPQVYMCSPSWTPLPLPSPYHPPGSSQCTSPEHPVSCIEPGLAIHFTYDNIHVLIPFSQIIPPSPSPTESKRLFYTSVSLLLSRIQGYC